jgi:AcrR family transcriptional regulator
MGSISQSAMVASDRLFAAAAVEFAACGFAGARMDRIAQSARVSKGLVYYYFHGKKRLYQSLLVQILTGLLERIKSANAGEGSPGERIARIIREYARFFLENPIYAIILLRNIADRAAHNNSQVLKLSSAAAREIEGTIEEGIANGSFSNVRPGFVHFTFFHPILIWIALEPERAAVAALHLTSEKLSTDSFIENLQRGAASWLSAGSLPPRSLHPSSGPGQRSPRRGRARSPYARVS